MISLVLLSIYKSKNQQKYQKRNQLQTGIPLQIIIFNVIIVNLEEIIELFNS